MEDRDFTVCQQGICHNTTRKVIFYLKCPGIICLNFGQCDFRPYMDCLLCDCGGGIATSNDCQVQKDCKDPLICRDNVCTYENVPDDFGFAYFVSDKA
uniref:Uncharacterized protein n=1 Tax=Romanomermis culicivorax TaxID=13658 RepID=A0A915I3F9_ROMCU